MLVRKGNLTEALPEFSPNEGVHYAGVLLVLPFLAGLNYLDTGKKVYGFPEKGILRLTINFVNPGIHGTLEDEKPGTIKKTGILEILGFSYIDGHVRPYHGRKHTLPKTHVARRRLCMDATTDFWVNGTNCEPLFFVTTEANNSLLSTVENEIIPELKRLSKDERVTLAFDREGWSPDRFLKWRDSGIDVLTYRKGKYETWSKDCFVEVTSQVRGESVTYLLGERSIKINKKGWVREVRRLCDNGHQTSVISTRQDLSMEEIARRMFFRWNQENYFKYMRDEYGLDHLVSRDVEQADVERMVPNPREKELVQESLKQERKVRHKSRRQ